MDQVYHVRLTEKDSCSLLENESGFTELQLFLLEFIEKDFLMAQK